MKLKLTTFSVMLALGCFNTSFTSCSQENPEEVSYQKESTINSKLYNLDTMIKEEGLKLHSMNYHHYKTRGTTPTSTTITQEEKEVLNTSLDKINIATKTALAEYGITEEELTSIFGDANDKRIALVGIILTENLHNRHSRSLEWDDYVSCAAEALGLNIFTSMRTMTKKAALQLEKQVAKRSMGPIGVGITVAEFSWCLYRNR